MAVCYVMIGLPGSGKGYEADLLSEKTGAKIVSTDAIREELNGDIKDQSNGNLVFEKFYATANESLAKGEDVIMDATNLKIKYREKLFNEMSQSNPTMIAVWVDTPYEVCLDRQEERGRTIPLEVMERFRDSFEPPQASEGWYSIEKIVYNQPELSSNLKDYYVSVEHSHCKGLFDDGQKMGFGSCLNDIAYNNINALCSGRQVVIRDGKENEVAECSLIKDEGEWQLRVEVKSEIGDCEITGYNLPEEVQSKIEAEFARIENERAQPEPPADISKSADEPSVDDDGVI